MHKLEISVTKKTLKVILSWTCNGEKNDMVWFYVEMFVDTCMSLVCVCM